MAAVIAENDKVRARHHLGYLNVEASQTFVLGVPAGVQTQFMIEGALNRVLPQSLDKFLELLDRLDHVECQVFGSSDLADISKLKDIEINGNRVKSLAAYYKIAQGSLANLLGIIPNPYDQREWLGGKPINVPVHG